MGEGEGREDGRGRKRMRETREGELGGGEGKEE